MRLALGVWTLFLGACARGTSVAERPDARVSMAAESAPSAEHARAAARREEPPPFFEELKARARALSERPARPASEMQLPAELEALSYDDYRKIRFRPEKSLWRGEPGHFEIQFFHAGLGYTAPVFLSVLDPSGTNRRERRVPFTTEWFTYGGLPGPPPAGGLEFTGFRVHAPLHRSDYRDEVVTFHGASYFRAVGKWNVYGLSARALSIDLGEPGPEEFPRFTHFYLLRPGPDDESSWILALLESRRATGAYALEVRPGTTTSIAVTAALYSRGERAVLGFAPLTSMYLSGEEDPNRFGDFRPEVHDSDGLALWSATGERLFRPLRNPARTVTSSFRLDTPRGFGLVQRDRSFDHYQDLEARYQDRPSAWVEPISGFGRGSVRLLEIASRSEAQDNIAMAWVPDEPPPAVELRYRLHVGSEGEPLGPGGRVIGTRLAATEQGTRFLVDFAGAGLEGRRGVAAVVWSAGASVLEQHVEENPFTQGFRASFEMAREPGARDVELRAFLRSEGDVLTETWSYLWQPS